MRSGLQGVFIKHAKRPGFLLHRHPEAYPSRSGLGPVILQIHMPFRWHISSKIQSLSSGAGGGRSWEVGSALLWGISVGARTQLSGYSPPRRICTMKAKTTPLFLVNRVLNRASSAFWVAGRHAACALWPAWCAPGAQQALESHLRCLTLMRIAVYHSIVGSNFGTWAAGRKISCSLFILFTLFCCLEPSAVLAPE